jgi:hypothetical protein
VDVVVRDVAVVLDKDLLGLLELALGHEPP